MTAGRSDPPGGPAGDPGNGDEEFRATVFDESFVRAAALQEYSAVQRLEQQTSPVRRRTIEEPPPAPRSRMLPRNGLAVAAVMLAAILIAVFLSNGGTQRVANAAREPVPAATLLPLAPRGPVPGAEAADLYAASPAAGLGTDLVVPDGGETDGYSHDQVADALLLARRYVAAGTLTPDVLTGDAVAPVRSLLVPSQQRQFDRATRPGADATAATTFLIRFDSGAVRLADEEPRLEGDFEVSEESGRLWVTARHLVAYALAPADDSDAPASLFLVRRVVALSFGTEELTAGQVVLERAETVAGPLDCAGPDTEAPPGLLPLLAGEEAREAPADVDAGIDLFRLSDEGVRPCGVFAAS
ncbi:hypothetical protein [Streptomyces sp. SM14]|uniref:SCO2583 family membrane protein n=1 Tax=Streptomyces sp. SM14 TaxID=1736045 RepID=UPI0011B0294D|nr:hypothetical protein [Streptomyces sp. SM14]